MSKQKTPAGAPEVLAAARTLRTAIGFAPKVGIVLGSGLGGLADRIEQPVYVPYAQLPGFAVSTAPGHAGRFVAGQLAGKPVLCMQGRLHFYEGHSMQDIAFPVRVMKAVGIETLILTNAAGGVNADFSVGDLMVIEDHINFMGQNPLTGPNDDEIGPRFCDMSTAYAPELRELAFRVGEAQGVTLRRGVYLGYMGPSYETPAEIRAFRLLGADAVGMSTVPEVIAAAHCGLRVLAMSLITNMAAGMAGKLSGDEVIETAGRKAAVLEQLVGGIVAEL